MKAWVLSLVNRPIKTSRPFIIVNLGLLLVVFVFILQPVISSWLSARSLMQSQQQLYTIYTGQAQHHDLLHQTEQTRRILPYSELAIEMENVHYLTERYGLTLLHFNAAEPFNTDTDGGRFVELVVAMTVLGLPDSCADFVAALVQGPAFMQNMRMELDVHGTAILRVEFSLFGIYE